MSGVSLASTWKQAVNGPEDTGMVARLPALARGERESGRPDCNVKRLELTGFPV